MKQLINQNKKEKKKEKDPMHFTCHAIYMFSNVWKSERTLYWN